ncbi:hypothetical protein J31TS4_09650 [Paenibacillus sp. J31TS4]|uniref:YheC/YheD family endospore coat-associated protein n=1 Tax=Paenibacillus sp. J31TS4 TaxID=2807195 RepID=UPI001B1FA873|nr:YheC/YheD family protein [Paenibacillus sp. J31TS4]GIP37685.1 hypothetical protein J31TS4_09650 [Paenibacillus sp. J31TS4]
MKNQPVVGILTYRNGNRFNEPRLFRDFVKEGQDLGITVFLFAHNDVMPKKKLIRGFVPVKGGGFEPKLFPWPDVVIDRCRKWSPGFTEMRRKPYFPYTSHKFTRKWKAMELFASEPSLKKWIPKTKTYSPEAFRSLIGEFPIVYVKPGNGTGGSGVVRVSRESEGYRIAARTRSMKTVTVHRFSTQGDVIRWLDRWVNSQSIRGCHFMAQQGLDLALIPDRVSDVRLLIQKTGQGKWDVTGLALRAGGKNSPTSNQIFNNGGKVYNFDSFMTERFGRSKAAEIREECEALGHEIVRVIESKFGSMLEFGLDLGVDVNGDVWLIEVNPKPAHDTFLKSGDDDIYRKSIRRPLQYAVHLARSSKRNE